MQPRTKRQKQVLSYITNFIEDRGYEPSYQQIARDMGVSSKGGIAKHIEALEKQGLLLRNRETGSFKLELNPQSVVSDLICQIDWLENPEFIKKSIEKESLYIPNLMVGYLSSLNIRALLVRDNALIEKHICEDDIALIELKSFVRDGECVAALINKEQLVLRYYYRKGADIEFVPANDKYETITTSAEKVKILGIYRGLLRPLI